MQANTVNYVHMYKSLAQARIGCILIQLFDPRGTELQEKFCKIIT